MKKKIKLIMLIVGVVSALLTTIPASALTVEGPGGVARLDYLSQGYFTWSAIPATTWPYVFTGDITYTQGYIPLFRVGALGSTVGGTESAANTRGKFGIATLSGTAADIDGKLFVVQPNVTLAYNTAGGPMSAQK